MPTLTTVNAQWTTSISVPDADLRRINAGGFVGDGTTLGARGGVVRHSDTSLAVTVNGSDQITVQPGVVVIPSSTALGGAYLAAFGSITGPGAGTAIAARNSTNPRIDLVIVDISAGTARIRTVDGTPSSSPVAPALPSGSTEIGRLNVPNVGGGAVTVTSTFRTYAAALGGTLYAETASQLPGSGNQKGQPAIALDTGLDYRWSGTDWVLSRTPGGTLGYAQVVAVQTGLNSTGANLTSLSVAVTVAASRRIRISSYAPVRQLTADGVLVVEIFEGATKLQRAVRTTVTNAFAALVPSVVLTPTAGAHTYNLKMATTAGTANLEAATDQPAYILVEDIGSV